MGGASPPRSLGFNSRATVTHFAPLCNTTCPGIGTDPSDGIATASFGARNALQMERDLGRIRTAPPRGDPAAGPRSASAVAGSGSAGVVDGLGVVRPSDAPTELQSAPLADGDPDDANDLRGFHFRRLMRKGLTIGLGRRLRPRRRHRPGAPIGPSDRLAPPAAAPPDRPASSSSRSPTPRPRTPSSRPTPSPRAAWSDSRGSRCRRRRRCCARATTATPSGPSPAARRRRRRHPRALHLRGGDDRHRGQPADQLLPLHGRLLEVPEVAPRSSRSSRSSASSASGPWRSSRTSSASASGSSSRARSSTSGTRSSSASRTT